MAPPKEKKRGLWTQEQLTNAVEAMKNGLSSYKAAKQFGVPRRTLRRLSTDDSASKGKLGKKPVLSDPDEKELVRRIHRLADVGMPLTPKCLRRSVYSYVSMKGLKHPFSLNESLAGKKWLRLFLQRHPDVAKRKAQNLNPARAQKLNRFIVNDHFKRLHDAMIETGVLDQPHRIFNIDEKGSRLTLHHPQQVLAKTGARNVHIVGPEHGENVTIVACANAIGQAIPPMIIFRGQRINSDWELGMPPGTKIIMTRKG